MSNLIEIKTLCQQYGIRPSKAKGQNFLINKNVLDKILQAANLTKKDHVLEIGPGLGILTQELIKNCKKVLAVELDKKIFFYLKQSLRANKNLELLQQDILKLKNQEIVEKLKSENYKVVANLPYNITKPVIRKFLEYDPKPELIVVLVQKEVAEKIIVKDKKNSILSLAVQFSGQASIIDLVPKQNFYPQPQVESAILKIEVNKEPIPLEIKQILAKKGKNFQLKEFWRLIKIGFSSPRKQLHNNLTNGFSFTNTQIKGIFEKCKLRPDIRAENLSLVDWANLYINFIG